MADEIKLDPRIEAMTPEDPKYNLFQTLVQGLRVANSAVPPDYSKPPYSTPTGETWVDPEGNVIEIMQPNQGMIEAKMAELSDIQMQNSAYLLVNLMSSAAESGSSGVDVSQFLQRSGDTMLGLLGALRGFEAGAQDTKIFDVSINSGEKKIAHVYGSLIVDEDATIDGKLNMSDEGIYFSKHQTIYYEDDTLKIDSQNIEFIGDINIDGSLALGDVVLNENGIYWNNQEFYHAGNSNNADTDWSMKDAHIYGDIIIEGDTDISGRLKALKGFDLGENGEIMLSSFYDETTGKKGIKLSTDLNIVDGNGIKFDDEYIIRVRKGADNIVSFSAPGKILNLGDSNGDTSNLLSTQYISLQADIKNYTNDYTIISFNGDGDFRNSLQAGCGNSSPLVLRTYYRTSDDCGVVFFKNIALGNEYGPHIYSLPDSEILSFSMPSSTERYKLDLCFGPSNYPWRNQSLDYDCSLILNTEGEYFVFKQPILSRSFAISSEKYQTRLDENTLFFNTGIFIEGLADGMAFNGNAYFNGNAGTTRFAAGVTGYGWGIIQDKTTGDYHATFDELTVRKTMRIYSQEVQKQNITNGSWWVTDSCSGDLVEVVL